MDRISNCQLGSRPQSSGFFERGVFQKSSLWFLTLFFFFAVGSVLPNKAFSQTTIITPATPFVLNNPGCNQENLKVIEIEFRDSNGNVFDPNALDGTAIGTVIVGGIWAKWQVSGNGYNPHIQYDIYVNDVKGPSQANCVVLEDASGNTRNVVNNEVFKIGNFSWEYGDKLEVKNLYINWNTGSAQANNKSCPTSAGNAQCSYPGVVFLVRTPLVANFDFETNCNDFTVDFENLTTGGNPADYVYSWSFTGGNPATSAASDPQNVDFGSANSYNVTLQVTSGGIVKSLQKTVTLYGISPVAPVLTVPTPLCDASSVTITFTAAAGVEYSLDSDFSTSITGGSFTANVSSSGTVYARTVGTTCTSNSTYTVGPARVTPVAPVLTVPAPTCDAASVTITFTAATGVEYSLNSGFTTTITNGSFAANVNSSGTVYARTIGTTTCVSNSNYTVDPAPLTPAAPVLEVPDPLCDATTVAITFTAVDGVEYSLNSDFSTTITDGSFTADVNSSGTVYAKTTGTSCMISSGFEVAPAPVTPAAPVLDVPAPACDAASVTITFTAVVGVEYSLNSDFSTTITDGSFTAATNSSGTVYARTTGTTCMISSGYEVASAPVTPAAPVLEVPDPLCDATTVAITFTAVDGVEYSLNSDFSTTITDGSFTADVNSSGTVYAKTTGTSCVISSGFEVAPAPVTPAAPVLDVPAPACDAASVTITFTAVVGVEYSLNSDFSTTITDGSFTANVNSSGTVYARTTGTTCTISSGYEVAPAPVTPAAPVLDVPAPACDATTVTITFTAVDGVAYSLNSDFSTTIIDGSFTADVNSSGTVYARTTGTTCVISSGYEVAPAPVTPAAPVLDVPAPACDAASVTITFTAVDGVEYSLNSDFSTSITDGSFTADVNSNGTVYARTIGTTCVISSGYEVAPAPVSPAAPVLDVPAPACDATTVTITFTALDGVEYSLNSDFSTSITDGSFTADVNSSGTVYARTTG
ncbi:hypothetical protein, partial [Algoriphagus aquimarinus]